MAVVIRVLEAADRAAWEVLWAGYLAFYEASVPDEVTEATWRRLMGPAGGIDGLVAVNRDGELVGFVHYLFHPVTWSVTDRCYLEDLYVAEAARGLGAGRRLMETVFDIAGEEGADQTYWWTHDSNETARRLYDRVGAVTPFIKYAR